MTAGGVPAVLGLDLSLTATGIAAPDGHVDTIRPPKALAGLDRIGHIIEEIFGLGFTDPDDADGLDVAAVDLVVIEGYAMAAAGAHAHELGALRGIVGWELRHHAGNPAVIEVPPTVLKVYATGNGRAGKPEVVANARERLGYRGFEDNEADAWVLRAIGLDLVGHPTAALPKSHTRALVSLCLPEGTPHTTARPVETVPTGDRL